MMGFVDSPEEIGSMLLWARYRFGRSFVKKDTEFWIERIEMLKGLL